MREQSKTRRTISRVLIIICLAVAAIPLSSALYRFLIAFYRFKDFMAEYVVPQGISVVDLPLSESSPELARFGDVMLPSGWKPGPVETRNTDYRGLRITIAAEQKLLLLFTRVESIREWLSEESNSYRMLVNAYGSWEALREEFSSNRALLDALLARPLPEYLDLSSASMKYPFGYYALPLFPSLKNYQREAALYGVQALAASTTLRLTGSLRFFYVLQHSKRGATILYGDCGSEKLLGCVLLSNQEDCDIPAGVIKTVCLCLEHSSEQHGPPERSP